jgi:hypothetical protein
MTQNNTSDHEAKSCPGVPPTPSGMERQRQLMRYTKRQNTYLKGKIKELETNRTAISQACTVA